MEIPQKGSGTKDVKAFLHKWITAGEAENRNTKTDSLWKTDIELGHHANVDFGNPDFVKLAESDGAKGYAIKRTEELLPTSQRALADNTVSVIACPVDYAQNTALTDS